MQDIRTFEIGTRVMLPNYRGYGVVESFTYATFSDRSVYGITSVVVRFADGVRSVRGDYPAQIVYDLD